MKRIVRLLLPAAVAVSMLAIPSIASANVTSSLGPNCSFTAYTPTGSGGSITTQVGVSCGGSYYNWSKDGYVCLQVYNANGNWYNVSGYCPGWGGWTTANPDINGVSGSGGVAGHLYRTYADGQVQHNGTGIAGSPIVSQTYTYP